MLCKVCGKKCEGEYCFYHNPRKPLPVKKKSPMSLIVIKRRNVKSLREFYLRIWMKRPHKSEVSGTYLGEEPLTTFFHHILPKRNYEQAVFDEENIILLTPDEHGNVENDMYRYEEVNKKRDYLKQQYNLNQ